MMRAKRLATWLRAAAGRAALADEAAEQTEEDVDADDAEQNLEGYDRHG